MFKEYLFNIKNTLSYRHHDKSSLKQYYIAQRLNKVLISYYADLDSSVRALSYKSPLSVSRYL